MSRFTFAAAGALVLSLGVLAGCTKASASDVSPPRGSALNAPAPSPATARVPAPVSSGVYTVPPVAELRARLTPLQFEVTQNAHTEPSFNNAFWNNHEAGIYVDVVTGEPLFSSQDKFESGTGWPSFTKPIETGRVVEHSDMAFGMVRTEVVSKAGHSHLGHVFDDGPEPTGMRYCINSASLRFIPVSRLVDEGYAAYSPRFGGAAGAAAPPPAASSNACAVPPPGETPGCSATLDIAIFARAEGDDRVVKPEGVLDVVRGSEGTEPAVEITFDPSKLTYANLLTAWTKGREKQARVFAHDDTQKLAATAKGLPVSEAVPFRRE